HPLLTVYASSERIRSKYPDRIPIICEKDEKSNVPSIDKKKFLVPGDLTVAGFLLVIRKRIKVTADYAICVYANGNIASGTQLMSALYDEHCDPDGFLYLVYGAENTFG
ncbi:unnamed protein product, partial [Ectocarpus fasciculatus]